MVKYKKMKISKAYYIITKFTDKINVMVYEQVTTLKSRVPVVFALRADYIA